MENYWRDRFWLSAPSFKIDSNGPAGGPESWGNAFSANHQCIIVIIYFRELHCHLPISIVYVNERRFEFLPRQLKTRTLRNALRFKYIASCVRHLVFFHNLYLHKRRIPE